MKISQVAFLAAATIMPSISLADDMELVNFGSIKDLEFGDQFYFMLKHEATNKCLGISYLGDGASLLDLLDCDTQPDTSGYDAHGVQDWFYDPYHDTLNSRSVGVGCMDTNSKSTGRYAGVMAVPWHFLEACGKNSTRGWSNSAGGLLTDGNKCLVPRDDGLIVADECPKPSDLNYANYMFLMNTIPSLAPSVSPSQRPSMAPSMSSDAPSSSPSFDQTNPWRHIPYPPNSTVALSNNVNWYSQNGGSLIDGDTRNESTAMGYPGRSCDIGGSDLGYVTVDLGYNHDADAVKVYMRHGDGRRYCNLFVSVWGDGEQEPTTPLDEPLTKFPTPAPTPAATTPPPTKPAAPITCHMCRGPKFICERSHVPQRCNHPEQQYCINDVENLKDGSRYVTRRCATWAECDKDWITESADRNECTKYNVHHLVDSHFFCAFCCKGNNCNVETVPENLVSRHQRRILAEEDATQHGDLPQHNMQRSLVNLDSLVYSSGTAHGYAPALNEDGFLIPFHGKRNIRYIRVWAGSTSLGGDPEILEVEALWTPFIVDKDGNVLGTKPKYSPHTDQNINNPPPPPPQTFGGQKMALESKTEEEDQAPGFETGETTEVYLDMDLNRTGYDETPVETYDETPLNRTGSGSASGDPHFKLFGGGKYDFHGGCDLVLLRNPKFSKGLGLDINIRTVVDTWWSYISAAVIRIGSYTFEVRGGPTREGPRYWINGLPGNGDPSNDFALQAMQLELQSLTGSKHFDVHYKKVNAKQHKFHISLNGVGDAISFETYKTWVSVNVRVKSSNFEGTTGLMGAFPLGGTVGRDGMTVLDDPLSFGKEWQVLSDEPMLFHNVEGVQHPTECMMPSPEAKKPRRLGESMIDEDAATRACSDAGIDPDDLDACVFDVLATNDLEVTGAH